MVVDNTVQWLQLNLKETGLPVGFEYFTTNPNIPAGSLPLQGGLYSRLAYPDLWEWVQTQQGYLIEESAWQAKAATNGGNVPFYSKGDGTTTFRVPSLKCWVKGASSISEVSRYLAAGLPNIEGQLGLWGTEKQYSTTSGAFSTNNGALEYGGGHILDDGLIADFNASLSNPIYGSSDTVQPKSIVGMWLVKAYGTVTNVGSTDVAAIAQGLTELETRVVPIEKGGTGALYFRGGNGADIVNDEVFTRVATEADGYGIVAALLERNGYVKFSNGLILQWGINQPSPITFPLRFASKCLTVVPQLQASGDSGNMSKNRVCVTNLTARGFGLENPQSTYNYIAIGV